MTDEEFYARRDEFLIPGAKPLVLHEWLNWDRVQEMRAEYPLLDIVDLSELRVGDEFLYRFPEYPSHMRWIEPEPGRSANALNLRTGGKHILLRWQNNSVPVVRLKPGEPLDPDMLIPRPPPKADEDDGITI